MLGVRNLNAHFLPPHLAYLKSFLNPKPMNLLFPVSVTVSTVICVLLVMAAASATDPFQQAGFTFLATMMTLAIAEHWFLVLPMPSEAMWNWSMKSREQRGTNGRQGHSLHVAHAHQAQLHDHKAHHTHVPVAHLRPAHR